VSRVLLPSNFSGPTVEPAPHGFFGPGAAVWYSLSAWVAPTVGFVRLVGVEE
jgi:hypothetical protein